MVLYLSCQESCLKRNVLKHRSIVQSLGESHTTRPDRRVDHRDVTVRLSCLWLPAAIQCRDTESEDSSAISVCKRFPYVNFSIICHIKELVFIGKVLIHTIVKLSIWCLKMTNTSFIYNQKYWCTGCFQYNFLKKSLDLHLCCRGQSYQHQ